MYVAVCRYIYYAAVFLLGRKYAATLIAALLSQSLTPLGTRATKTATTLRAKYAWIYKINIYVQVNYIQKEGKCRNIYDSNLQVYGNRER